MADNGSMGLLLALVLRLLLLLLPARFLSFLSCFGLFNLCVLTIPAASEGTVVGDPPVGTAVGTTIGDSTLGKPTLGEPSLIESLGEPIVGEPAFGEPTDTPSTDTSMTDDAPIPAESSRIAPSLIVLKVGVPVRTCVCVCDGVGNTEERRY